MILFVYRDLLYFYPFVTRYTNEQDISPDVYPYGGYNVTLPTPFTGNDYSCICVPLCMDNEIHNDEKRANDFVKEFGNNVFIPKFNSFNITDDIMSLMMSEIYRKKRFSHYDSPTHAMTMDGNILNSEYLYASDSNGEGEMMVQYGLWDNWSSPEWYEFFTSLPLVDKNKFRVIAISNMDSGKGIPIFRKTLLDVLKGLKDEENFVGNYCEFLKVFDGRVPMLEKDWKLYVKPEEEVKEK